MTVMVYFNLDYFAGLINVHWAVTANNMSQLKRSDGKSLIELRITQRY